MGKKSKKTTWRNLPIEGNSDQQQCSSVTISDSEESHITINSCHSTLCQRSQRYHDSSARGNSSVAYSQRYDPTTSARYHSCNGHGDGGGEACARIGHSSMRLDRRSGSAYRAGGSKAATVGDGEEGDGRAKITFNEDEYTRITTPRQDVLFKKGYLNRPRPSVAITSTADGSRMDSAISDSILLTPEHQLMPPESRFCYPTTGYIARDGLYFFNGFEPYPVVVYNATPPQYCFSTTDLVPSSRSKRYSTDSMTESTTTSPQTEEHSGGDGETPSFLISLQADATLQAPPNSMLETRKIQTTSQDPIDMNIPLNGNVEQRKLKKKRRRKLSKPINKKPDESTTTSMSVSEDEITTSTDTEEVEGDESKSSTPHVKETPATSELAEESPSTCPNSPPSGSSSSSSITTSSSPTEDADQSVSLSLKASSQLKPDAKEFIPRHYSTTSSSVSIDYFNQNQAQYHLIDQLGRPFIQSAFMPLPILLSPHYMMPPPPPYATLSHQNHAEGQMDVVAATVDEVKLVQTSQPNCNEHTETTLLNTEFDIPKMSFNVELETPPNSVVQTNLSKDDIKVIVSKVEEAMVKEQEKVIKNERNYCNNKRSNNQQQQKELQFAQKHCFNKNNVEGSPNRSYNNRSNIQCSKNVTWPQRKPYSNLFKPTILQNQLGKPVGTKSYLNTSLKTPRTDSNKQNILVNQQSRVTNKLSSSTASTKGQSNSCTIGQATNPWINVSNRKKRRSNGINLSSGQENEEQSLVEEIDQLCKHNCASERLKMKELIVKEDVPVTSHNDDGFEQYDVDELVDVVVEAEIHLEEVLEDLPPVQIIAVKQEHKIGEDIEEKLKNIEDDKRLLQNKIAAAANPDIEKESKEEDIVKMKQNKKSNNKSGKQIKRVMVIDNIQPITIKETPVKKNVEANKETVPKKECATAETTPKALKTRTKKKSFSNQTKLLSTAEKSAPIVLLKQHSSSSSDSYNFIPSNSENKTNVEVSQELDMLIQRGMYSSLEEKIRSFNITASNDGFFKTINYYGTGKLNAEMTNSAGNKDLDGILKDLKPALKNTKFDFGKMNVPTEMMSKQCANGYQDFLGLGPDPHEPDKNTTILDVTKVHSLSRDGCSVTDEENYPITRAVKEWMTKTREHTPEIELLKSPTTILRQFTTALEISAAIVDDVEEEVTLWTLSNQDSVEADQDLLDCWETENIDPEHVKSTDSLKVVGSYKEDCFVDVELKMSTSAGQGYHKINHDLDEDEMLEIYESRYGKNEDFVRIREEWEERSKSGNGGSCSSRQHSQGNNNHRTVNIPPTASLPYRAICCAVM